MPTTNERFQLGLRNVTRHLLPEGLAEFERLLALELLRRFILRTPVDTGFARSQWQINVLQLAPQSSEITSDGAVLSAAVNELEKLATPGKLWIVNVAEYIKYLDQGRPGPGSPQAPNGIVELALLELAEAFGQ